MLTKDLYLKKDFQIHNKDRYFKEKKNFLGGFFTFTQLHNFLHCSWVLWALTTMAMTSAWLRGVTFSGFGFGRLVHGSGVTFSGFGSAWFGGYVFRFRFRFSASLSHSSWE